MIRRVLVVGLVVGALMAPGRASAAPFTFTQGNLSASATFTLDGSGNLVVDLKNTATGDVWDPASVLTGIFFDIGGSPTLTPLTAKICAGCSVTNGGATDAGGLVNGEWAFKAGTDLAYGGDYGISSTGLGIFGPKDLFPGGSNFYGPNPGGVGYGITTIGDDPQTNGGLAGVPLISNEVIFTLQGTGIDVSRINRVSFQYGTALNETVPEPATLALFGPAAFVTWMARRRQRRRAQAQA